MEEDIIINRVTNSSLVSLDLEDYYPKGENILFDIAPLLYEGLILKEKDFRLFVKEHDWIKYIGKNIGLYCSEDAIVPTWAYMLLVSKLQPVANFIVYGDLQVLEQALWQKAIKEIDISKFSQTKVVIKGCSKLPVPVFAYTEIMRLLMPIADSLAYGEPCSTVPIYKKRT
jgi:hypothetical protein